MDKLEKLRSILKKYQKVAIAYSGGCDSNFLLQVAIETLGKGNVLAVLCVGDMLPIDDLKNARTLLKDVNHKELAVEVLEIEEFRNNDKRRCYFCKKAIMTKVKDVANNLGYDYILDGKNLDDEGVYRPGIEACKELGILSPLSMSEMTKLNIRGYSKQLGISTHNRPANACLASRFNYNTILTKEKLLVVDKAESLFHKLGIYHVRVRMQDEIARIEIEKQDFDKVVNNQELVINLKKLGLKFITLDLEGITSGSYDK